MHKLNNRSGELWSPLVELAAFIEEQRSIVGLLDAISNAAEWDEQIGENTRISKERFTICFIACDSNHIVLFLCLSMTEA